MEKENYIKVISASSLRVAKRGMKMSPANKFRFWERSENVSFWFP